jgi:hypothetical protein
MPSKGISSESQLHISVAFLIKAMIGISMLIAAYYNVQMRFASIESRVEGMHEELVVLNSKVASMENKHIVELEEQNKSLMQRLGLKKR